MDQRERREAQVLHAIHDGWCDESPCDCGNRALAVLAVLGQDEYEQVGSRWHNGEMVPTFVRRAGEGTPPTEPPMPATQVYGRLPDGGWVPMTRVGMAALSDPRWQFVEVSLGGAVPVREEER